MLKVPTRLIIRTLVNGKPTPTHSEHHVELPLPDDAIGAEGTCHWDVSVKMAEHSESQEGVMISAAESSVTLRLKMGADAVRAALFSEKPSEATVVLPMRLHFDQGKQIVRDSKGTPQAVVERQVGTFAWDRSHWALGGPA